MTEAGAPPIAGPGARPPLVDRVVAGASPEEILDRFVAWVTEGGFEPYPAQEEALLELMSGRHVILATPTGSGKSLVALGLHFKALCEGRRSFYTAPVKALVNEKFFALCNDLGPQNVAMLTGDASINPDAPVVCCTAEVLSNMVLRQGEATDAPYVVMDEFHYYGDADRGVAWQIPLIALRRSTFLLMSATLGDVSPQARRLHADTGREVATVESTLRPVPLDYEYRETSIHETVEALLGQGRAPIYIVHFTQRECAEQAQGLTSARVSSREERDRITEALEDFRFDTAYGKDVRRFLRHGIGIHHAGLLPKYRLLVEQLSQQGLLKVICGTDTLGVGVNIPIRTVLFTRLCKFDGEKVAILTARDFHQIAGRAGRKGHDDLGSVVCQAPEHVIENKRRAASGDRKVRKKAPPTRGFVPWNQETFEKLITRPPEAVVSRFTVTHGMLVDVMQREGATQVDDGGYRAVIDLIARCHEDERSRSRLRRQAAERFRSLRGGGIIERVYDPDRGSTRVRIAEALQLDFSLHHALSLYLVEAIEALDPMEPNHALDVVSLVEAILENPVPVLRQQESTARDELLARLKAEGVPFEERIARLDDVTYPKPLAEFIYQTFNLFERNHPWVAHENIRPKSVAREMLEDYASFQDYVRRYGVQRSEGTLLRYLAQVHGTLDRNVPDKAKTDAVLDVIAYFRALLERIDSSLLDEWESLVDPGARREPREASPRPGLDPALHPKAFAARVRSELHALVRALAAGDFEEAALCVRQDPEDPWTAERFEAALAPFLAEYERIVFEPRARQAHLTVLASRAPLRWDVSQVLLDPRDDNLWCLEGEIVLEGGAPGEGALMRLRRIGT